jgi:hypothetical protein
VSTYHYEIKPISHDNHNEGMQVDNTAETVEDWKL